MPSLPAECCSRRHISCSTRGQQRELHHSPAPPEGSSEKSTTLLLHQRVAARNQGLPPAPPEGSSEKSTTLLLHQRVAARNQGSLNAPPLISHAPPEGSIENAGLTFSLPVCRNADQPLFSFWYPPEWPRHATRQGQNGPVTPPKIL